MNRKFFMLAVIPLLCLFTYGCGSHEIESENSSPIIETVTETSVVTETQTSCTLITAQTDIVLTAVTSETVSETSQQVTVASSVQNTAVATSTTFKSPSGETNFKTITNQHAQYEPRVPAVLKPHEPVIYTTAPPDSENPSEATTTLVSDIIETEPPEESSENNSPEPVTPDELYFYGMTPSDDIKDLIGSFGEYESMTSTAGEYTPDEVQAENRHYYFSNMELITFVYDDMEILGEVIIKDDTFLTSRNISIGMTADDVVSAYGKGEFYDNIYRYQTDTGYIYFHVDENNIVDYIGMHGIY